MLNAGHSAISLAFRRAETSHQGKPLHYSMNKPLPTMLPVQHYFKCIDADGQPDGYVGDWPRKGNVYTGCVKPGLHTGEPHVYLDGFHVEEPYGSFKFGRFIYLGAIWLN